MGRRLPVTEMPFKTKVYINGQILIPANIIERYKLDKCDYANIMIEYKGNKITLKNVKMLKPKAMSRQVTIPIDVRRKFGIMPNDVITVLSIEPIE